MSSHISRDEIDFDWAFVQLLCIHNDEVSAKVSQMYPEVDGGDDFIIEFNVAQAHRNLGRLGEMASQLEADLFENSDGENTEQYIDTAHQYLCDYVDKEIAKIVSAISLFRDDPDADILVDADDISLEENTLIFMLPLFYDFHLNSKNSSFFTEKLTSEVCFKAFGRLLKSKHVSLRSLKSKYKALLEEEHCFLSFAPFDEDFELAQNRFFSGENQYLTPEDVDGIHLHMQEEEQRVEILITKASIIDRQKFEAGDVVEVYETQALQMIDLGKASFTKDADYADAYDEEISLNGDVQISHSEIDFSLVKHLVRLSEDSNFEALLSDKYPSLERQVAILAIQEQQLIVISRKIRLEAHLQKKLNGKNMPVEMAKDMLNEAYVELDRVSKSELMPLFFSTDMKTNETVYIPEHDIRDLTFKAFKELIKSDGLTVNTLKSEYLENQELAYLLPLANYLKNAPVRSYQSNAPSTTNATPLFVFMFLMMVLLLFYAMTQ